MAKEAAEFVGDAAEFVGDAAEFVGDYALPIAAAGAATYFGGPTAGALVGGPLFGAQIQSDAAKSGARAQERALRNASATQLQMFEQQRRDAAPWRRAGIDALSQINQGDFDRDFTMSDFSADPGYQFRLTEGQKAIERSAAARGGLNSGATLKALSRYGQGVASDEYQNAYNRFHTDKTRKFNMLSNLAGLGQTANTQLSGAGQNYANQLAANQTGMGNVRAAGQIGRANILSDLIGTGINTWQRQQWMNRLFPTNTSSLDTGERYQLPAQHSAFPTLTA